MRVEIESVRKDKDGRHWPCGEDEKTGYGVYFDDEFHGARDTKAEAEKLIADILLETGDTPAPENRLYHVHMRTAPTRRSWWSPGRRGKRWASLMSTGRTHLTAMCPTRTSRPCRHRLQPRQARAAPLGRARRHGAARSRSTPGSKRSRKNDQHRGHGDCCRHHPGATQPLAGGRPARQVRQKDH